jgi:hypothetical protein
MAGMTNDVKNTMLDAGYGTGASSGTYMSLHSADPTTTVATALANEIAGGSPAYARKQVNFAAASAGAKAMAASVTFDIQAGDAFSYYALWSVASGGTQAQFKGGAALTAAEGAYGSQGTYVVSGIGNITL